MAPATDKHSPFAGKAWDACFQKFPPAFERSGYTPRDQIAMSFHQVRREVYNGPTLSYAANPCFAFAKRCASTVFASFLARSLASSGFLRNANGIFPDETTVAHAVHFARRRRWLR